MTEALIRAARAQDAEEIVRMVAALSQAEGEPPPRFDAQICRRDGFGAKPLFAVLMAEIAGRTAGYALYHPSYDTDRVLRAVWLADLYVESWARGRGLGRQLAAEVANLSRADKVQAMHWAVLRRNLPARRFYARFAREDDSLLHCFMTEEALGRLAGSTKRSAAAIRPAGPSDAALLGRLVKALLLSLGETDSVLDPAPHLAADGFGASPWFRALIAEIGEEVAGYALYWPIYDTELGGTLTFLSDLLVNEGRRGSGVAEDLMAAVARQAVAAGHKGMAWEVLRHNQRARAFYRRLAEENEETIVVNCVGEDFRRLATEASAVSLLVNRPS
jgi:GNAT superfamily N-acetyltransferase